MEAKLTNEGNAKMSEEIGYCMSSAKAFQLNKEKLMDAGCDRVFYDDLECCSGMKKLIDYIRPGDILVIPSLAHIGSTVQDIANFAERLPTGDVKLKVLNNPRVPQDIIGAARKLVRTFASNSGAEASRQSLAQSATDQHAGSGSGSRFRSRLSRVTISSIHTLAENGKPAKEIAAELSLPLSIVYYHRRALRRSSSRH